MEIENGVEQQEETENGKWKLKQNREEEDQVGELGRSGGQDRAPDIESRNGQKIEEENTIIGTSSGRVES